MNTPTYKEQFDKITGAYIRGEIQPYEPCACFIGNLLNGKDAWNNSRDVAIDDKGNYYLIRSKYFCNTVFDESGGLYTLDEIIKMELNFLNLIEHESGRRLPLGDNMVTENSLFNAMSSTLDMLREIHISKGENVDVIPFTKRELVS